MPRVWSTGVLLCVLIPATYGIAVGQVGVGKGEIFTGGARDTFPLKNTSRVLSSFNGFRPIAWAPDADLLLIEASRGPGRTAEQVMVIYDPKADTSLDVPLTVVGWGPTSHELVRMSDDSVRLSAVSDFGTFR